MPAARGNTLTIELLRSKRLKILGRFPQFDEIGVQLVVDWIGSRRRQCRANRYKAFDRAAATCSTLVDSASEIRLKYSVSHNESNWQKACLPCSSSRPSMSSSNSPRDTEKSGQSSELILGQVPRILLTAATNFGSADDSFPFNALKLSCRRSISLNRACCWYSSSRGFMVSCISNMVASDSIISPSRI